MIYKLGNDDQALFCGLKNVEPDACGALTDLAIGIVTFYAPGVVDISVSSSFSSCFASPIVFKLKLLMFNDHLHPILHQ